MSKDNKQIMGILSVFIVWGLILIALITIFGPLNPFWQSAVFNVGGILSSTGFLWFIMEANKKKGQPQLGPTDVLATLISYITGPVVLFTVITLRLVIWRIERKNHET